MYADPFSLRDPTWEHLADELSNRQVLEMMADVYRIAAE